MSSRRSSFPGGDIGCLAVHGTINDVAVMGATAIVAFRGLHPRRGLPLADLARIVAEHGGGGASAAGVPIVTGDTKVVERGKGDGVFITTTGVGSRRPRPRLSGRHARPGDVMLFPAAGRPWHGDHGRPRKPGLRNTHRFRHRGAAWTD
jgi:hydrogenase expression/formation protein HypE